MMHHSLGSIQAALGGPVALLLLTLLIGSPCSEAVKSSLTTSAFELISALRDPDVAHITLGPGVLSLDSLLTFNSGGLVIGPNRHVVIAGTASAINEPIPGVPGRLPDVAFRYTSGIDFGNNAAAFFKLSDNTTLGFQDLILIHGLSQLGYDWQVVALQQPKTVRANVEFLRTVKVRDGCLPLQIFVQHVTSYNRLDDAPGQQAASLQPFCYRAPADLAASLEPLPVGGSVGTNATATTSDNVTCVAETLAIADLATFITRSNGQSYRLYEQNSTYWCRAYVSMSCLSASGPEQCVKDLLAAVGNDTGNNATNASPSPPPVGKSKGEKKGLTNVLLPALLTGILALAFVAATVWCIYRRGGSEHRGSSLGALAGPGARAGGDVERGARGRVGDALARLLPRGHSREAQRRKPYVPGYVPVVSKEALDCIAKVRAELSSKMVVASSEDDLSDVRNLHLVGKGTFGRVYKGEWKGVTVALKVISVPVSQYGQAQWQHVLGEAAISTLLNHPCVLQTYSVALLEYAPARKAPSSASDDGGNSGNNNAVIPAAAVAAANKAGEPPATICDTHQLEDMAPFYQLKMVSEFCEGGSVVNALRRMQFYETVRGGAVRMPAIIDIASQVASGIAYLHSANIIHADLKAANVLLKQQPGSGRLQAKVADFGLSFRMDEPEATHVTKGQLGSITHMAPEVLLHGRVSKSSDVYSFGILLYELYTGQQAYWDVPPPMLAYHVATAGGRPVLPPHCPSAYRGLAKACWSSEPASRPTFTEVYNSLQALADDVHKHAPDADKMPPPTSIQQDPAPAAAAAAAAAVTILSAPVAALSAPQSSDTVAMHQPDDGRVAPPPSKTSARAIGAADAGALYGGPLAAVPQPGTPAVVSDDDLRPQPAAACLHLAAGVGAGAFPISDLGRSTQGQGPEELLRLLLLRRRWRQRAAPAGWRSTIAKLPGGGGAVDSVDVKNDELGVYAKGCQEGCGWCFGAGRDGQPSGRVKQGCEEMSPGWSVAAGVGGGWV